MVINNKDFICESSEFLKTPVTALFNQNLVWFFNLQLWTFGDCSKRTTLCYYLTSKRKRKANNKFWYWTLLLSINDSRRWKINLISLWKFATHPPSRDQIFLTNIKYWCSYFYSQQASYLLAFLKMIIAFPNVQSIAFC